jgi:hypothetical protein
MTGDDRHILCETHGDRLEAFVCSHIVQSLRDGSAQGFNWTRDENGCVNAWCDLCDRELDKAGGAWNDATEAFARIALVCEGCALRAAELNGLKDLPRGGS